MDNTSCNPFNSFNNQVILFNNQVDLNLIHVYTINVLTKHVYDLIDLFI